MIHLTHALRLLLAACALAFSLQQAHAGRNCEADPAGPSEASVVRGLDLAAKTARALDESGAQVVILARAGQDLTRYGLRYSHLGIAYRQVDADGLPAWRVLHKLNACGTATAALYREGLGNFFLDDLWRMEAAWVVPSTELQQRLAALVVDDPRALRLHEPRYSMVSYAWGTRYQQSNQWALETLALALEPTVQTRSDAQGWLRAKGYEPSRLTIGTLTRLGGRLTRANVAFDDHPDAQRFADRIDTVTVDSVFAWLRASGLASAPQVLGR